MINNNKIFLSIITLNVSISVVFAQVDTSKTITKYSLDTTLVEILEIRKTLIKV